MPDSGKKDRGMERSCGRPGVVAAELHEISSVRRGSVPHDPWRVRDRMVSHSASKLSVSRCCASSERRNDGAGLREC